MIRVGVFSDTHGDLSLLYAAKARLGAVDMIVHLGDFASDAKQIGDFFGVPVEAVSGNCDFRAGVPSERMIAVENARILIMHGDGYRDIYRIALKAEEQRCDAVLFGHTHVPLLTAQGKLLIVNPGSLSHPRRQSACSCALLTVEGRDVDVKLLPLKP